MPYYIFEDPISGKTIEVFQKMEDSHVYEEGGRKWNRIFTSPNATIDSQIDPYSSKDFNAKMASKKHNVGNMWDAAKELSIKRTDNTGYDPIKQKFYENYEKKNRRKHPDLRKKDAIKNLNKLGVDVEM